MDAFGDNLYNIYGSTEVAYASIADPVDLREAPDSAGRPPYGTVVKILDEDGKPVPDGESGRIFVGNSLLFEGYTGGGHKEVVDGLMSSGDVGRFGEDGRLYVEGRDDEMIVSGGENVFPKEVEDCLARHDSVVEVAAIGVDDDEFGKRLKAFVVVGDGADGSEDELKDWVKQNLARYKVPREIVFLDELPRNSTGKILKRELAETDSSRKGLMSTSSGLAARRPGPRLHAARPVRAGRDPVVVPGVQGRRDLIFYPYAFSGVCTGEMAGIRDRLEEFLTFDTEVLAISCDPVYALRAFADSDGLNFPLLSDFWPHGEVTRAYDVFDEAKGARAVVVRHRQGRRRALGGAQRGLPRSGTWGSIWPSSRPWPRRFS